MKKSQSIRVIAAHRPIFATATELRRGVGERGEGGQRIKMWEGGKQWCRRGMRVGEGKREEKNDKTTFCVFLRFWDWLFRRVGRMYTGTFYWAFLHIKVLNENDLVGLQNMVHCWSAILWLNFFKIIFIISIFCIFTFMLLLYASLYLVSFLVIVNFFPCLCKEFEHFSSTAVTFEQTLKFKNKCSK